MLDDLRDTAAEALPPPHEQEPPTLRQEILEELTDHFACAYRRELLRTHGDEDLSKRNVLARFGDPARIARQLWFDAMKGKLMAQKLMVATTTLCAVLMIVIAVLGWRLVESNQQATAALIQQSKETSAALLEQSRATQAAILARLEARNPQGQEDAWSDSLEWRRMTLKFVQEETGKPAREVKVSLNGPMTGLGNKSIYAQSYPSLRPNEKGIIELAPMHVGEYSLTIRTPWGASAGESFSIRPGHDFEKTYRVPAKPEMGRVDLQVEWLERLRKRDLWAIVGATQELARKVGGMTWYGSIGSVGSPRFFAVHPDGRIIDLGAYYHEYAKVSQSLGYNITHTIGGRISQSTWAINNSMKPGLEKVFAGTIINPYLLGIYPEGTLPDTPQRIAEGALWIGISKSGGSYRFGEDSIPIVSGLSGHSLSVIPAVLDHMSGGVLLSSVNVYRTPIAEPFTVKPNAVTSWTVTIPKRMAQAIPDEMLPPITPVVAPKQPRPAAADGAGELEGAAD